MYTPHYDQQSAETTDTSAHMLTDEEAETLKRKWARQRARYLEGTTRFRCPSNLRSHRWGRRRSRRCAEGSIRKFAR